MVLVFTKEVCLSALPPEVRRTAENLNGMTESDALHAIEKLKIDKTLGPDKITPKILKEFKHQVSKSVITIKDSQEGIPGR